MRMRRSNNIRPCLVDFRMDHEPGFIDGGLGSPVDNVTLMIHKHQI